MAVEPDWSHKTKSHGPDPFYS